jgi:hypothetical protein
MAVRGDNLKLYADGRPVVEAEYGQFRQGMHGFASLRSAAGAFGAIDVKSFSVMKREGGRDR